MKRRIIGTAGIWFLFLFSLNRLTAEELRIGTILPEKTKEWGLCKDAFDAFAGSTEGRLNISLVTFDSRTGGVARAVLEGRLDGGLIMGLDLFEFSRDASVYAFPFTFTSAEQAGFVRQKMDNYILKSINSGLCEAVGFVDGGFSYAVSSNPLSSPGEWLKRTIWVPDMGDTYVLFPDVGLTVKKLPVNEVRKGFKSDSIDTVVAPLPLVIIRRWHTSTAHVFDAPVMFNYGIWVLRKDIMEKLDGDTRGDLIKKTGILADELSGAIRERNDEARRVLESWQHRFEPMESGMRAQWKAWRGAAREQGRAKITPADEAETMLKQLLQAFDSQKTEPGSTVNP